jgi:hypothetical protein
LTRALIMLHWCFTHVLLMFYRCWYVHIHSSDEIWPGCVFYKWLFSSFFFVAGQNSWPIDLCSRSWAPAGHKNRRRGLSRTNLSYYELVN